MLSERNVIYGFCNMTNPPKHKYLISLHRSPELNIIACFTTSQERAGTAYNKQHGYVKNKEKFIAYFFKHGVCVGKDSSGLSFSFPQDTTVVFDYCFQDGDQNTMLSKFDNPEIKCILSDKEYVDLIYAMYKSPDTPKKYIPIFEAKLNSLQE